jgi:hypothetical protein
MADQFNDSIPAVTNQITEDVADIAESLGFLKDCFEATCTGWNNADASGLKVDQLADAVTRTSVLQGGDVSAALWRKIVSIGDWDMDANGTVDVAHGLTLTKIRSISGVIRNDADTTYFTIPDPGSGGLRCWAGTINVVLYRPDTTSVFDSTDYNATSFNRGWLVIEYIS